MTDKLFFSYSRFDSSFVLKLANDLRNVGADVWLDQLDIPPGAHWDSEIEKALNNAGSLLVIISPKSLASDNAMDEVSYALEKKKRVIPIMLTDSDIPFRLRRLQRVDFTGDYYEGFKQLKQALKLDQQAGSFFPLKETDFFPIKDTRQPAGNAQQQAGMEQDLWKKCCDTNTVSAYQAYLRTTGSKEHLEEAWKRLDTLQEKPLSRAIKLPKADNNNAVANGKKLVLLGGLLVLLAGAFAAYKMVNNRAVAEIVGPVQIEHKTDPGGGDTIKAKPSENPVTAEDKNITKPVIVPAGNDHTDDLQKNEDAKKVHNDQHDKIPSKKSTEARAEKKDIPKDNNAQTDHGSSDKPPGTNGEEKPPLDPPSPPPASEKKRTETTELRTDQEIQVELELVGMPNMHEKKKTDQPVKFRVTKNVVYQGQIIVEKGSLVNGTLTIGSIQTDIEMKNVQETNGKMVRIKSKTQHGRREKMETGKEVYGGVIEKGTRL